MTYSNAAMVLILAAAMVVGCSNQHAESQSATPIPLIQLRVVDADSAQPLERVMVHHQSTDYHNNQFGLTDANGEFRLGPNLVGDKVWLLFPDCDAEMHKWDRSKFDCMTAIQPILSGQIAVLDASRFLLPNSGCAKKPKRLTR